MRMSFSDFDGYTLAELSDPEILNKIAEEKMATFRAARGNGKSTSGIIQYLKFQGLTDEEIKEMFKLAASITEQS